MSELKRDLVCQRAQRLMSNLIAVVTLVLSSFAVSDVSAAEPLARVEAEAMIARLSDQEVRDLLISRIAQGDEAKRAEVEEFNPAVIMYRLQRDVGRLSEELDGIFAAVGEFPGIFPLAWQRFSADREQGGLLWFVVALVVSMGAGALLAWLMRMRVNALLASADRPPADSTITRFRRLGRRLLMHGFYIVVFVGAASVVFIVGFDDEPKDRITYFFYLAAAAIFLASIALSHAVHAPTRPALRLPLYSDAEAQVLHRTALVTTGFGAFAYFTCALFGTLGILGEVHELFLISVALTTTALLMFTVISGRVAITRDITSGAPAGSPRATLAVLWPWLFAAVVGVMMLAIIVRELLYDFVPYGAALFTVGAMAVVPAFDAVLYREAQQHNERDDLVAAAFARSGRFALLVLVALAMCVAWRINPFSQQDDSLGAALTSMFLQLSVVLLIAYASWQLIRIVCRQGAQAAQGDGS